ncbi:hypothetical protein OG741_22280 [Streptomyces sp. NBC_01410]|uniref:hypothetical protein n=1 Tax=Streptomyces sp. NBC_01410 TaxID=2903856 RepID=UPI003246EDDE
MAIPPSNQRVLKGRLLLAADQDVHRRMQAKVVIADDVPNLRGRHDDEVSGRTST